MSNQGRERDPAFIRHAYDLSNNYPAKSGENLRRSITQDVIGAQRAMNLSNVNYPTQQFPYGYSPEKNQFFVVTNP